MGRIKMTFKEQTMAEYLAERSKGICRDNGCTEDQHQCESYAYFSQTGLLLDVCISDFFQGSSGPVAAISLPWSGTQVELDEEIAWQTADDGVDWADASEITRL